MSTTEIESEIVEESARGLSVAANGQPAHTPAALISIAVQNNLDIDKLEKLLQLQREWDKEQARKAFFAALSRFQSEIPPIIKSDRIDAGRAGRRKFAKLGTITEAIKPHLEACGLSFRFSQQQGDNGVITVTCIVSHADGHCEQTSLAAPPDNSQGKNPIQMVGSTITYLQRYTLVAALGLTTVDEDDDGETADAPAAPQAPRKSAMELMQEAAANAAGAAVTEPTAKTPTEQPTLDFQRAITACFDSLALTDDQRTAAIRKRNPLAARVEELTDDQAANLLAALEQKIRQVNEATKARQEAMAAEREAKAAARASEATGKSRLLVEPQNIHLDGPCTEAQVNEAKRLLVEMEQRKPGTCDAFRGKLAAKGRAKVSDCTVAECMKILQELGIQNLDDFFALSLQKQTEVTQDEIPF